jgi:carboxyl-terminal processing protease
MTADSIHFPDSLKYKTMVSKRTVYGGGGIMPDVFVPADTMGYSDYYRSLVRKGVLSSWSLEFSDKNRKQIASKYKTFNEFRSDFNFSDEDMDDLKNKAEKAGVKFDDNGFKISRNEILTVLKGYIAANIWKTNEFYMIINEGDPVIESALRIISDRQQYEKALGFSK